MNITAAAIYSKYPDMKIDFSIKMVKRNVTVSVLTWSFCIVFVLAVTKSDKVCIWKGRFDLEKIGKINFRGRQL